MFENLFRRKPKIKLQKLYVPDNKIEEFYKLVDNRHTYEGWYKFRCFIQSVFPETKGNDWSWSGDHLMQPYIEVEYDIEDVK